MIMLKVIAVVLGAGLLLSLFSSFTEEPFILLAAIFA
jgi:hypothetical protein